MGTKTCPSDHQTRHINQVLVTKELELSHLENQVANVQSILQELLRERDVAQQFVDSHRALLAPIRRMPLEIMQEIFVHCLPTDQFIRPDAYKAPLLLGQICRAWRRAALSTPALWNSLAIQLSQKNSDRRINLIKSWITRSSGHPICLFAYIPMAGDDTIKAFLEVFTTNIYRWKNLRLTLPGRCYSSVLQALSLECPLLESAQIRFSPITSSDTPIHPERLSLTSQSAPRLRSLTWNSQGLQRVDFALAMNTLTDIDIDYPLTVPECLDIMAHCPKLVQCEFKSVSEWAPTPNDFSDKYSIPLITLPQLRMLSVHATESLGPFFERLSLPSMEVLKLVDLSHENDFRVWSQSSFNDFMARSSCSLTNLHLLNVLPSEDDLIQCLQWVSNSLTELRLLDLKGVTVVMNHILHQLTARQTDDGILVCLCPKLEVVKLGTSLASSDGVLAAMVESRWKWAQMSHVLPSSRTVVRLKSINPRLDRQAHPDDLRRLELLRLGGLDLL